MALLSPLARPAPRLKHTRARRGRLHGIVTHTPGSTIVQAAITAKRDPFDYIVAHYLAHEECPSYVIGYKGQIVQLADEGSITFHAGVKSLERKKYLDGSWRKEVERHALWDAFWHPRGFKNPTDLYHLVEGAGVNDAFIGVEIVPLVPTPKGLRYTKEQHAALARLVSDIVARHALFDDDPARILLGHEDVNPLRRFNAGGGWDPGALRDEPWFDWRQALGPLGGIRP